jgi:hypothetical protein
MKQFLKTLGRASIASLKFDLHLFDCIVNKVELNEKVCSEFTNANLELTQATWKPTLRVWNFINYLKGKRNNHADECRNPCRSECSRTDICV